jgi:hypothetical protein
MRFYSTKLQVSIVWWKIPQHFDSKKVSRWIEHGVKAEFSKGVPFAPKTSVTKFVDPQDVDFAIKDLLKGRHIGAYQDLVPGGEQFCRLHHVFNVSNRLTRIGSV